MGQGRSRWGPASGAYSRTMETLLCPLVSSPPKILSHLLYILAFSSVSGRPVAAEQVEVGLISRFSEVFSPLESCQGWPSFSFFCPQLIM